MQRKPTGPDFVTRCALHQIAVPGIPQFFQQFRVLGKFRHQAAHGDGLANALPYHIVVAFGVPANQLLLRWAVCLKGSFCRVSITEKGTFFVHDILLGGTKPDPLQLKRRSPPVAQEPIGFIRFMEIYRRICFSVNL